MKKLTLVFLIACSKPSGAPSPPSAVTPNAVTPSAINVTSTAFTTNAAIPALYSCDGKDVSPPLAWTAPPDGAAAFVLIVDDPDAPGGVFTHLIAWNARTDSSSLGEGASPQTVGATLGKNGFGKLGWSGPCPPRGQTHHYRFRILAVDKPIAGIGEGASRAELDSALAGHVIGDGTLVGTFQH
jgi:Raf kinase inhibitor-like YbhB/YbcL family protein